MGQLSDALPQCSYGPCYYALDWRLRKRETQSLVILGRFHPLLFPPLLEGPSPRLRFSRRTPNRFRRLLFGDCLHAHIEQGGHPREFGFDPDVRVSMKQIWPLLRITWSVRNKGQEIQSSRLTILPLSASTRRRRDSFTVLMISTS